MSSFERNIPAKHARHPIQSLDRWPYAIIHMRSSEIMRAVSNPAWQEFRESMKGMPTARKLAALDAYRTLCIVRDGHLQRVEAVRIDNYINSLLRGGLLVKQNNNIIVQR